MSLAYTIAGYDAFQLDCERPDYDFIPSELHSIDAAIVDDQQRSDENNSSCTSKRWPEFSHEVNIVFTGPSEHSITIAVDGDRIAYTVAAASVTPLDGNSLRQRHASLSGCQACSPTCVSRWSVLVSLSLAGDRCLVRRHTSDRCADKATCRR